MKVPVTILVMFIAASPAFGDCAFPKNDVEKENCRTDGVVPPSQWDILTAATWETARNGDLSIQGFATDISVNVGNAIQFKVKTPAAAYRLDIYRMGYYGGQGARLVTTIASSAPLPQVQPACLPDPDTTTKLVDCGNWAVSASWAVPVDAVSGIYFARLVRADTGGASHIFFIVRNDTKRSDLVFQTSDATWQAYNSYTANLYGCNGNTDITCRAFKVSYNRPSYTRQFNPNSWVFNAEYPMVRWLEANGYDVSYVSEVDIARYPNQLAGRKVFLSVGHNEYVSGEERANL
jgi:hypothetical protein